MKSMLFTFFALSLSITYSTQSVGAECLEGSPIKNSKVAFEQLKKLDDGSVWIKGIHLVDGQSLLRIKASDLNKKRICQHLGFRVAEGARIEFDNSSLVVGINKDLKATSSKKSETKFIQNITCR